MGLQEVFKAAAQMAFEVSGNIKTSVTYTHVTANASYNPATGAVSTSATNYTVSVIFDEYESEDVDGVTILNTDQIAMIPVENLPIIPSNHDYMEADSKRWNVVNKKVDPANALWILQTRKP